MKSKLHSSALVGVLFFLSGVATAGTVAIGSAAGDAGTSVELSWSFSNTSSDQGIEWCLEWDADLTLSDSADCLANMPAGFDSFSQCVLGAASCPNGLSISVVPNDFTSEVPTLNPVGNLTFAIAAGATTGDELAVTGTCTDVVQGGTSAGCGQMSITNGEVTVTESVSVLNVTPASITFANQEQGTTSTASTVTVANTGSDGVDLEVTGLTFSSAVFAASGGTCGALPFSLSDGQSCTVGVTFTPVSDIQYSGTLTVVSDADSVTNNEVAVSGKGELGPAGALTITPETFNFGELLAGIASSEEEFAVKNEGAAGSIVAITGITTNFGLGSPMSLNLGTCDAAELGKDESCVFTVTYTPSAGASNPLTRTVTVSGTDGNGAIPDATAEITGTPIFGSRPTADPAFPGASESEVVGPERSNDFTVVWGNEGNESYDLLCELTGGDNSTVWTVTGASETIASALDEPNASHTVTTTCALPDTETYTETLTCTVTNSEQQTITYTYNYECVGLPPLPVPVDNKWALALLAMMMLMAASFGFRFIVRR